VAEEQTGGGVVAYIDETRQEIRKVVWPTREEAWNLTVVVLFVVMLVMLIIFGIDFVFSQVFKLLFALFGRG
jgi:preprotein translocase subunit SecE